VLHDNDRVEIYRELVFDPKDSRRRRATHKEAAKRAANDPLKKISKAR
jgi:hypothetical protein